MADNITNHNTTRNTSLANLKRLNTEITVTLEANGNLDTGLTQTQKCGGVKHVIGSQFSPLTSTII